ncbi:endonuclease/exonuclease/phosphatase family protein [Pasteurella atlantica]|uniref:endonuclease/exonuclease/phosphatase family protein n=1 Tax=Pasteurellaceae TaxID=712 RepID=UPI0027684EF1|nr:endonuclease/exonuclease/phosphatase family protein [Pasteurella atlantica]MDP8098746.1 endonuclease/exonuclease/phosphatase family protein [Pasteurella atlantica]MDP8106858.1 endonuclease/exonuclease/phosphatase family protein [Pasteurella atlantica]MDP8116548.1 endonuclease/exonuclease/phosphatase family protein [Pasteurella atlantica]
MKKIISMRRFVLILLMITLLGCDNNDVEEKIDRHYPTIKVATYNVSVCNYSGIDNVVKAIKQIDADIIGLSEVDNMTVNSAYHSPTRKSINQAKYIAEKLGMNFYFNKAENMRGGEFGTAILSKYLIKLRKRVELPYKEGHEHRSAAAVDVTVPGYSFPIVAVVTHLDHIGGELHEKQVRHLRQKFSSYQIKDGVPIIFGDLNLFPTEKEYRMMTDLWTDTDKDLQYTAPSWNPDRKIDYILTSNAQKWEILSAKVPLPTDKVGDITFSEVSDHLPLVVEMKLIEE